MNRVIVFGGARANTSRGFSLFEMVVVMGIVGILLTIAIPSYRYVTTSNRISAEINGLLGDLQYARSEAIKEGQPVSTCVSANGTSCTGGTAWNGGWIVFSDANGDGTVNGSDFVIRAQSTFTGTDAFVSTAQSVITYNREGFATNIGGNTWIVLQATPPSSASTRCMLLFFSGVALVAKPSDNLGGCS